MKLPDTNPKTRLGVKKPGFSAIPPVALLHLGAGMADGEKKYGLTNWREHAVTGSVYYNAAFRHLLAWWDGEEFASDSGVHHLGHAMACFSIILDAQASGKLNDDRPAVPGQFSESVKSMTESFQEAVLSEEEEAAMRAQSCLADTAMSVSMGSEKFDDVSAEDSEVARFREDLGEIAARLHGLGSVEETEEVLLGCLQEFFGEEEEDSDEEEEDSDFVQIVTPAVKMLFFEDNFEEIKKAYTPKGYRFALARPGGVEFVTVDFSTTGTEVADEVRLFLIGAENRPTRMDFLRQALDHLGAKRVRDLTPAGSARMSLYAGAHRRQLPHTFEQLDEELFKLALNTVLTPARV